MKLSREWRSRLDIWIREIQKDFYILIDEVQCSGFTTMERLSPEEALAREFVPMPVGTPWGKKWEYGWFKTEITIPAFAEGKRIIFSPEVGGETLVWVNGRLAGSKDLEHNYVTLTKSAKAKEAYDILMESYAGHGPRLENGGPYYPGSVPVPEPPEKQVRVNHAVIAIWNEPAYQVGLDAYTLDKLLTVLEENSLRAQKVFEGLKQFTYIVDFEQPLEKRVEGYMKARKLLEPLLLCVNGSTAPEFTIFGQSHLDLAWKWPFEETKRKCARTISSQLALMDEYPEYRFMVCQIPVLENIRKYYPELYLRVKEKINNGQLIPEGGFYVESDTNIPSGESLIRQLAIGKRCYKEEYGCDSRMAWLPDTFGFTAALPQIMKGCGIRYFATQKLLRCHPESDPFPYNIFMWEGIDGSQTLSHMFMENNSGIDPELLVRRWNKDRNQKEDIETFMFPFGYGDGGGGPTRDIYELARRVENLEGAPRTKLESPVDFFEAIEKKGLPKNKYVGELYLQWHRGTYTSLAALKKGCRKSEVALHDAELWSVIAETGQAAAYPRPQLAELWKKLLFNQFHDILAGTSITRVNDEAKKDFEEVCSQACQLTDRALSRMLRGKPDVGEKEGKALSVFNSLSWTRSALVRLPSGSKGATDTEGKALPVQLIGEDAYTSVKVPACGVTTIYPQEGEDNTGFDGCNAGSFAYYRDGAIFLENEYIRVRFNKTGQMEEITDKETGIQLAQGLCNNFKMYRDVNIEYDAWELGSMYESLPVELVREAEAEIVFGELPYGAVSNGSRGNLTAGIKISRKLNASQMSQTITLEHGSRRVDFKTEIDWREQHKILKVEFPLRVHADEAIHEIQFGYIKRPNHKSRKYDADRFEVSQHRYTALAEASHGTAVLNDCKYGVNVDGNSINLTLLKAPVIPDMYADKGLQEFTYSLYVYNGAFADSGVVQNGYELNYPVLIRDGAAGEKSFFSLETGNKPEKKNPCDFAYGNVILETVKKAEDGSGDIILRLYEAQKATTHCILKTQLDVTDAYQADMLENTGDRLEISENGIELHFRPFEIKTIRIKPQSKGGNEQ
jgi:alpha-mannosidase